MLPRTGHHTNFDYAVAGLYFLFFGSVFMFLSQGGNYPIYLVMLGDASLVVEFMNEMLGKTSMSCCRL